MDRHTNEAALRIAGRALEVVRPCLRPDEAAETFRKFHDLAKEEIGKILLARATQEHRMRPADR